MKRARLPKGLTRLTPSPHWFGSLAAFFLIVGLLGLPVSALAYLLATMQTTPAHPLFPHPFEAWYRWGMLLGLGSLGLAALVLGVGWLAERWHARQEEHATVDAAEDWLHQQQHPEHPS